MPAIVHVAEEGWVIARVEEDVPVASFAVCLVVVIAAYAAMLIRVGRTLPRERFAAALVDVGVVVRLIAWNAEIEDFHDAVSRTAGYKAFTAQREERVNC